MYDANGVGCGESCGLAAAGQIVLWFLPEDVQITSRVHNYSVICAGFLV